MINLEIIWRLNNATINSVDTILFIIRHHFKLMDMIDRLRNKLNHLRIKTKLLIYMALPFALLSYLAIDQISNHIQAYNHAKQGTMFIDVSLQLESLMVEIQKRAWPNRNLFNGSIISNE